MGITKTPVSLSKLKLPIFLFSALAVQGCSWELGHGEVEPPEMHRQFSRTVEILEHASLMPRASQLERVADHTGHIAVACGRCHEAASGGPRFVVAGGPPQGSPQTKAMTAER